tara:strand:- start:62 stop:364 length:303 start_codon:yes stop_codon:yes gene_type:complete
MKNLGQTKISPFMIIILVVWFIANLLSQLVYISINGTPYDGIAMLSSLGPYYYLIIAIELFLWLWFFCYLIVKAIRHFTQNRLREDIGNIGELTKTISPA